MSFDMLLFNNDVVRVWSTNGILGATQLYVLYDKKKKGCIASVGEIYFRSQTWIIRFIFLEYYLHNLLSHILKISQIIGYNFKYNIGLYSVPRSRSLEYNPWRFDNHLAFSFLDHNEHFQCQRFSSGNLSLKDASHE